jgi:hypothetical protein
MSDQAHDPQRGVVMPPTTGAVGACASVVQTQPPQPRQARLFR